MENSRSELRKKIMTILYQINMYKSNKIEYNVDDILKEVLEILNFNSKDKIVYEKFYQNSDKISIKVDFDKKNY